MNYQEKMDEMISKIKKGSTPKLLLHACCAPCSSYCIEYLSNYFNITIYYYNPNIDTKEEYDKRVDELNRFVSEFKTKNPVKVVVENYDSSEYYKAIEGLEDEGEGSTRCFTCYELRMRKAALYAKKNRFKYFTTTLSISPYKNSDKLNEIGEKLGEEFNLKYLYADFKKKNGYKRSIELSKEYNLYRQDYCGCKYSKIARDNRERLRKLEEEKRLKEEEQNKKLTDFIETFRIDKPTKKVKTRSIKKLFNLFFIFIILSLSIVSFYIKVLPKLKVFISDNFITSKIDLPNIKDELSFINDIYIYGKYLNIKGSIKVDKPIEDVKLSFYDKNHPNKVVLEEKLLSSINDNNLNYYLSSKINDGFHLDILKEGSYIVRLELTSNNEKEYYNLSNNTKYKDMTYYTVSDEKGNVYKVNINFNKDLIIDVKKTSDEVYDVILDAGHGGNDPGAKVNGRWETQYTLPYTLKLKGYLEELGLKVALTRTEERKIADYNEGGRVNKIHESNAKLSLSIHFNNVAGANYHGFELYCPYNSDLTFARKVATDMNNLGLKYSINRFNKVENGIYIRTMDDDTLREMQKGASKEGYTPFNVDNTTNYYFMIREIGEHMTGAYRDGRDGTGVNFHIDSNRGTEGYIFEMGYIGNNDDMTFIEKNNESLLRKLAEDINKYLKNNI